MMIRKYKKEDIDLINELGKELHNNYNFVENELFHAYVIHEKEFIGFVTYSILYDKVEILDLIIKEEYRNKGYASMLIKTVINDALDKECINITLEVNSDNIPAINLYKKLGFDIAAIRKNYYKDNDGYLMIKDLR